MDRKQASKFLEEKLPLLFSWSYAEETLKDHVPYALKKDCGHLACVHVCGCEAVIANKGCFR